MLLPTIESRKNSEETQSNQNKSLHNFSYLEEIPSIVFPSTNILQHSLIVKVLDCYPLTNLSYTTCNNLS